MSRKVKVGIIGLGENGLAHIEAHLAVGKSEIVALCDRNPQRLETAGRKFGIHALYADDNFFLHPEMEAVSVNTGDAFHREPFLEALAAGKHVLIEKPLANTEHDILAMVSAADAADPRLKTQVGYILRFNPVFKTIYDLARAGAFGDIYYLEGDYIHNLLYQKQQTDPTTGHNWYLEEEMPMVGGGSHPLDIMRWISGKEVVAVSAYQNHFAFPEMEHDDCQVAVFRFQDGTIAKTAALYAPRCGMAPYYNLRLYGTKGTVERDQLALSQSAEEVHPPFHPVDAKRVPGYPYDPEVEDWLEAITMDRPTRIPLHDGANSTLSALCAVRAAEEGREITVPVLR